MKLHEVLSLKVLEGTHVVAGNAGLSHDVRWVHISDVPDLLPWVQAGQLLLTTGYAWPRDEEAQCQLVRALAQRHLAGVCMAVPQFFEHFSDAARKEADCVRLPLLEIPWDIPFARITEEAHRAILAEQYHVIERSEVIHRALTQAALEAASLRDLAQTLSRLIRRTVAFVDLDGLVLAIHVADTLASTKPRDENERVQQLPSYLAYLEAHDYLPMLRRRNTSLHIPAATEPGFDECILCPIRLQDELIGLVWIIEGDDSFSELDVRAAEHAAIVAALYIMHQRELSTIEARFGYTFLDSLLEGRFSGNPQTLERARLLGFDPYASYRAGLIVLDEPVPLSRESFLRRERLVEKLRQRLRFLAVTPLVSVTLNQIPFLLPASCDGERIWNVLCDEGIALAFGLPHSGIEGVQRSYSEVRSLLPSMNEHRLYCYEQLLLPRVLVGDPEAQRAFLDALFGHLTTLRNGETLIKTLTAWAQCGFRMNEAAAHLSIHPKTLQYRLARASDLTALDLTDPDTRFRLQLATHLLSLAETA